MFPSRPALSPEALNILHTQLGVSSLDELPYERRQALLHQITRPLWVAGNTDWLLTNVQRRMRAAWRATTARVFFTFSSRRIGKSHWLTSEAIAQALRVPNARVLYLAPTKQNAREISQDLVASVLEYCPPDLRPEFHKQDHEFQFKNGSLIRLRGVNGETADNLRGGSAHLIICDEFGFWDEPERVLQRVALPMTMTTDGRVLVATTPAEDPGHYSSRLYLKQSEKGASVRITLLEADHIPDAKKAEYLEEAGERRERVPDILAGRAEPETTACAREYFCRVVADSNRSIIPEFTQHRAALLQPYEVPPFADRYVALDPGMVHKTGVLYGHSDFFSNRLVILREALLKRASTPDIARQIRADEYALWAGERPYLRVSDVDLRLIEDLRTLHKLDFAKAQKQDLKGGVNLVRALIKGGQLLIDPGCKQLLTQMEMGVWAKSLNTFNDYTRQDPDAELGHLDLLACLVYICRAWWTNRAHNPYPRDWFQPGHPGGPVASAWVSPKARRAVDKGLLGDTPLGKRLHKARYGGRR